MSTRTSKGRIPGSSNAGVGGVQETPETKTDQRHNSQGNRWSRVSGYSPSGIRHRMSNAHDITEDIVFNLVSIQYHALHGSHLYRQFLDDVRQTEHPEVEEFIKDCQQ